jgi:hypothetical protein
MDGFGKLFFFAIVCYCCCSLRVVGTARVDKTDGIPFRCLIPTPSIHRKKTYHTDGSLYFSVSIYSKRGYLQFNIRRASLAEYDNTVKWEGETGISFFGCWESYRQTKPNRRRRRICPLSYSFSLFIIIIPLLYFNPPEYERILSVYFSYTIHESWKGEKRFSHSF